MSMASSSSAVTSSAASSASSAAASSTKTSSVASAKTSSSVSEPTAEEKDTISDINSQLDKLEKEQKALEALKNSTKSTRAQAEAYKKALDKQIKNIENQLDLLGEGIDALTSDIGKQEAQIATLNTSIETNTTLFKQRLRAIYMSPKGSELEALLSSKSFADLLTRAELLKRIAEHDTEMINKLKNERDEVAALKADTETKKTEKTVAKAKQQSKMTELDQKYAESAAYIKELKANEAAYAKELAAIEAENNELEKQLDEIYSKYRSAAVYVGGEMAWPVPGFSKISSPYGKRGNEIHTGVDIAGSGIYGQPVVAANGGTVVGTYNLGSKSYGKYIIIDHGGGIWTYYAHLSGVSVTAGQKVKRGETIGKVGSTGRSTGPHLHFEIRINNKHTNPMPYIT